MLGSEKVVFALIEGIKCFPWFVDGLPLFRDYVSGKSSLEWAASAKNVDMVELILNDELESLALWSTDNPAAAMLRERHVVQHMISKTLGMAAENGDSATVDLLLTRGSILGFCLGDFSGFDMCMDNTDNCVSPLHRACLGGHEAVVRKLLDSKIFRATLFDHATDAASVHSALNRACMAGHLEIARLVLNTVGDRELRRMPKSFCYPLTSACEIGNVELVRLLLNRGADINHAHERYLDEPPLSFACLCASPSLVDVVRLLLERLGGAFTAIRDDKTKMESMWCTLMKELVKVFEEHGAKLPTEDGRPTAGPLHGACETLNVEMIKYWLDQGCDVNGTWEDTGSCTPLLLLCGGGSRCYGGRSRGEVEPLLPETIRLLLSHGADATVCTPDTYSGSALRMILNFGCDLPDAAQLLISAGADPNPEDGGRWPILCDAIRSGYRRVASLLVQAGARLKATANRNALLHYALLDSDWQIAEMLLRAGADVNEEHDFIDDNYGRSGSRKCGTPGTPRPLEAVLSEEDDYRP
jgi:ankyrin repeat protein